MHVRETWQAGLKEDKTTNRAAWRKKIISYTGSDPRWRDKPGKKKSVIGRYLNYKQVSVLKNVSYKHVCWPACEQCCPSSDYLLRYAKTVVRVHVRVRSNIDDGSMSFGYDCVTSDKPLVLKYESGKANKWKRMKADNFNSGKPLHS